MQRRTYTKSEIMNNREFERRCGKMIADFIKYKDPVLDMQDFLWEIDDVLPDIENETDEQDYYEVFHDVLSWYKKRAKEKIENHFGLIY